MTPTPASEAAVLETVPTLLPVVAALLFNSLLLNSEGGWPLRRLASDGTASRALSVFSEGDLTGPGIAEFNGRPSTPTPVFLLAGDTGAEFVVEFSSTLSEGAED